MDLTTTGHALLEQLPPPLPAEHILAINQPKGDLHTTRHYTWNGWTFDVPPGVFVPGGTSRMIHERVLDGRIEVRGRRYAAMGAGLGVEAVAAGLRGAREIHALDVHGASVAATTRHYRRIVGDREGTAFTARAGDLFDALPPGARPDVVTFNPPAVSRPVSEDPDVVRNVCVGAGLLCRFFAQLAERALPAPGGEVFVIASNTADLRAIVGSALDHRFVPHVAHLHDWDDGVLTFLFRFTREGEA
ncbi:MULTISPECIES: methyltransferase [unclassified Streptomyces]|uniref:methyltransferase n=1 Tax=unclassified Streptomyces TaxID=2593676 RepID=UPI0015E18951|nr:MULTISPECIES: methyltransferase [unclassified Streptomyces]